MIVQEVSDITNRIFQSESLTFKEFEQLLHKLLFGLGRLFVALFLCLREERQQFCGYQLDQGSKTQGCKDRLLGTLFGKVRYWQTYIYQGKGLGGYYPLDLELSLPADGFSMPLRSLCAKIATKMSYAQSVAVLTLFLGWSPCQKTVEEMVLGLGRHTTEWFESAAPPEGDGTILIIQMDSKGTPTATEEELEKRKGERSPNLHPDSPRHRRKELRTKRGSKKRKKKGDKSKNARMATIVVMYTLKRSSDGSLEGPINKKVYASYSKKRHAVAIARREADKRGFNKESGKLIQIVTDGDNDLDRYISEFFPEALHTIDIFHVTEYLWAAGGCLYKEGSSELIEWVESQKNRLYNDEVNEIIDEIESQYKKLPKKGPGMKKKREKLSQVKNYLQKREEKMNYQTLRKLDLEISSGAVEGAVNYVIAKRFDCGGMRWVKERAEALLHLRCIEINEDWEKFIDYVHDKTSRHCQENLKNEFLKSTTAPKISTYGLN